MLQRAEATEATINDLQMTNNKLSKENKELNEDKKRFENNIKKENFNLKFLLTSISFNKVYTRCNMVSHYILIIFGSTNVTAA